MPERAHRARAALVRHPGRDQPPPRHVARNRRLRLPPPPIAGVGTSGGIEAQLQDFAGRPPQDLAAALSGSNRGAGGWEAGAGEVAGAVDTG